MFHFRISNFSRRKADKVMKFRIEWVGPSVFKHWHYGLHISFVPCDKLRPVSLAKLKVLGPLLSELYSRCTIDDWRRVYNNKVNKKTITSLVAIYKFRASHTREKLSQNPQTFVLNDEVWNLNSRNFSSPPPEKISCYTVVVFVQGGVVSSTPNPWPGGPGTSFIWSLPQDLSGLAEPARSLSFRGIGFGFSETRKFLHHSEVTVRVEVSCP